MNENTTRTAAERALDAVIEVVSGYRLNERVRKKGGVKGGYSGPGVVRGVAFAEDGGIRVLVGHKIEGGEGLLLHVYTLGNIEKLEQAEPA